MKNAVEYALLDPTGNLTLLVETPVPPASQPAVAALLTAREPETEQVGFLSPDNEHPALRMAGGEFCGNASMSAAVLHAMRAGLSEGSLRLRVSGADEPVAVSFAAEPDGSYGAAVAMPRPVSVRRETLPDEGPLPVVRFPGIAHVILEHAPDRDRAEALAPVWCRRLGADALGLLFWDRERGTMAPLVFVPKAGTLCWERSCASGTTAVGAYLREETGASGSLSLRQPGGTLTIDAAPDGALWLRGSVRLRKRGSALL